MEVYLDNSATTKPYKEVVDEVSKVMIEYYGNPSSIYSLGVKAKDKLNECKKFIANTINCDRDEIIFTSSGSESNNFLLKGLLKENDHLITTKIEHSSILNTCKELEGLGVKVTYLDVDCLGRIDINSLKEKIREDTKLVSIMHVNNEIGVVQDIETIGRVIKEVKKDIIFHVDIVQSYGKYSIDVKGWNVDLLSASGHKIHGPRGIGFAYIRKGIFPKPLINGGGQENNLRSGTENLPGACGFAKAAEIIYKNREENFNKVKELKRYFIEKISKIEGVIINSPLAEDFSPYVVSLSFYGIRSGKILFYLQEKGIYVSKSSACSSRKLKDSHVLLSINLHPEAIKGSLRVSFSEHNTKEEIDYTVNNIEDCLKTLKEKQERIIKNIFITSKRGIEISPILKEILDELEATIGGYKIVITKEGDERIFDLTSLYDGEKGNIFFRKNDITWISKLNKEIFNIKGVEILKKSFNDRDIIVMDEIGFLESKAEEFKKEIINILESPKIVLGVLKDRETEFLDSLRKREDIKIFRVEEDNKKEVKEKVIMELIALGVKLKTI